MQILPVITFRFYAWPMRAAFKDWAVVVDALGHGEQILILRKGGIAEGKGGFRLEHDEFLLFPTLYHQQGEMVIPSARSRYDELAENFPPEDILRLEYFARVVDSREIRSLDDARRLAEQHIWRDQVIEERFEWGKEQKIFAIALRVFRLPEPVELPLLKEYGGCKSWIELNEEIDTSQSTPALDDALFASRLNEFRETLRAPSPALGESITESQSAVCPTEPGRPLTPSLSPGGGEGARLVAPKRRRGGRADAGAEGRPGLWIGME